MTAITLARLSDVASIAPSTCEGRLTLETAVPISTTDQTAKTTLYFTPYLGSRVSTYSGSAWSTSAFTEKSITLASLTANKNYDCFIVDGTLALELLVWTNDTTRATALVLQDGVYVKSGATTRRYLGTIRITGTTGQCEDSLAKRFVWNMYNRVSRPLSVTTATSSWVYNTATWRQANADTALQIAFVMGIAGQAVRATRPGRFNVSASQYAIIGIGLNQTTANDANNALFIGHANDTHEDSPVAEYIGVGALGYTYLAAVEYSGGATVTHYGSGQLFVNCVLPM